MLKDNIYVLAISGLIDENLCNFSNAYNLLCKICDNTMYHPTHVYYKGEAYYSKKLVSFNRLKNKLLELSKVENFLCISLDELPKDFEVAAFDYIFSLMISPQDGQFVFVVKEDTNLMKRAIPIILEVHRGDRLNLFKTTDAGNYLDIFDEDECEIEGYEPFNVEHFLADE